MTCCEAKYESFSFLISAYFRNKSAIHLITRFGDYSGSRRVPKEKNKKDEMAKKTRGVFQVILKSIFENSSKVKIKPKFMGEDYYGTKYYEEPAQSSGRKTRGRYFEPVTPDNFQQELPAEWEAWLRYRRAEPPTEQELQINYKLIITKRENAAKLEAEYDAKREKKIVKLGGEQHAASAFPTYKEYEQFGRNYDPKNK